MQKAFMFYGVSRIEFWLLGLRPWILIILNKDINIRPYNWVVTLLILLTEHHSHENFNQLYVCIGYTYHVISHGAPALYHLGGKLQIYNIQPRLYVYCQSKGPDLLSPNVTEWPNQSWWVPSPYPAVWLSACYKWCNWRWLALATGRS